MFNGIARLGITQKVMLVAIGAALLTGITTMTIGSVQAGTFADAATAEAVDLQEQRLSSMASSAKDILRTENATLLAKLDGDIRVGESLAEQMGGFNTSSDRMVSWSAINQFDKSTTELSLPQMRVGDQWLGKVDDPADNAVLVDEVLRQVGAISTVFQRTNTEGDMLRVATNVAKTDGTRAIGTYIPAINPDGNPNAVVSTLLDGETFLGTAFVVNRWYLTAYAPIFDNRGDVIGSFFVGLPQDAVAELKEAILGIDVGENGFMTVVRASGAQRGDYVFGPDRASDATPALDVVDANGQTYIQQIVDQAVELESGEVGNLRYESADVGSIDAYFTYFQPWDWVIVVNAATVDSAGVAESLAAGRQTMRNMLLVGTIVSVLLTAFLGLLYARRLTAPIKVVADRAKDISGGDFDFEPLKLGRNDEVGDLADSFNHMTGMLGIVGSQAEAIANRELSAPVLQETVPGQLGKAFDGMIRSLKGLIGELRTSSAQLSDAADGLATVSASLGANAERTSRQADVASSTGNSISGSVDSVAASVDLMRNRIGEIAVSATEASRVASEGVLVASDTSTTISKLSESSEEVGNVIKVINSIAEQTNLLALNATIEAARAGEAGKGFAVVANEVKELANQTASATDEISARIETIQRDANGAVEANSKISETIDRINDISISIAAAVEEQSGTTSEIGQSITEAATGTGEIARSIDEVAEAANSTRQSTAETQNSATELAHMASSLNDLVDQFS